jgi:hypothetical protein
VRDLLAEDGLEMIETEGGRHGYLLTYTRLTTLALEVASGNLVRCIPLPSQNENF